MQQAHGKDEDPIVDLALARTSKEAQGALENVIKLAHEQADQLFDKIASVEEVDYVSLSKNLEEQGYSGFYFYNGLKSSAQDTPQFDSRYYARGIGQDFGQLEILARTSPEWQRIIEGTTALFRGATIHLATEEGQYSTIFQDIVKHSNKTQEGNIKTLFLEEMYSLLVYGFCIHEIVDREDGRIKKLSYRQANTVDGWILDETQQNVLAVRFRGANQQLITIPIDHLLIVSWRPLGTDLEGQGPLRVAAPWIIAKRMVAQAWQARLEKFAQPIVFVEDGDDQDASDTATLMKSWNRIDLNTFPLFKLKKGQKIHVVDLGSGNNDFQPALEYFDRMILSSLSHEGAQLGMTGKGAYSLAEMKDYAEVGASYSVLDRCVDAWNGDDNVPWHGISKRILSNTLGLDYDDETFINNGIPQIKVMFGEIEQGQAETPLETIIQFINLGMFDPNDERLSNYIASRLGLPFTPSAKQTKDIEDE